MTWTDPTAGGSVPTLIPVTAEMMRDAQDHANLTREMAWRMAHAAWAHGPPEPVVVDVIPDAPPPEYDDEHRRLWAALHEIATENIDDMDDGYGDGWAIRIARDAIGTDREFRPGRLRPTYCPPMPEEPK